MNVNCKDRDRIFEDGTPAEWVALEAHAAGCAECAEELRAWKSLSVAAAELRDYSESPSLWPRIERALQEQAAQKESRRERWSWASFWRGIPLSWQAAAASAFVLVLALSAGWIYFHPGTPPDQTSGLLKSRALTEVERNEAAYVKSIDKLEAEAKPQLDQPSSALLASYREKLTVLNGAIQELRAEADRNPANAHLRRQLLAMYQEKQETLREVLEEKQ